MARRRKAAFRKRQQNKMAVFMVTTVLVLMAVVILYRGRELSLKQQELAQRQAELESMIEEENKRSESLEEYEKYTHTKKFAEEVAREKFGLVHEDEILFKSDEE